MALLFVLSVLLGLAPTPAEARSSGPYSMDILVNGRERPEYSHKGRLFIEALENQEYSIRLTNNTSYRVAVALSVDGLNTIDADHTTAWKGSKWVLDPYESTEISGWQVQQHLARSFFFTTTERSYGEWLGDTRNLGVISAVFYRERTYQRSIVDHRYRSRSSGGFDMGAPEGLGSRGSGAGGSGIGSADSSVGKSASGAGTGAPSAARSEISFEDAEISSSAQQSSVRSPAATGIGDYAHHAVSEVDMTLLRTAVATLELRYEFGADLVKMGVLPLPYQRTWTRRRASGFAPDPGW